jgi:hypothetical protein
MIFKKISVLALVALFTSVAPLLAGKFKEIPKEGGVILQYDDDEGRRGSGFTIEVGHVEDDIKELEKSINSCLNRGEKIVEIDFSNSDLTNKDYQLISEFLIDKKIDSNLLKVDETDVDFLKENISPNYTKDINQQKAEEEYQYQIQMMKSMDIPKNTKKIYEDNSDSD